MKKFLAMFVATLCMLSLFNYQPALANSSLIGNYEFYDGELIISIKSENLNDFNKSSNSSDFVATQKDALTSLGLEVLDSMMEPSNDAKSMSAVSNELKNELLETMGSVFLVKYNKGLYSNNTNAISDLKEKLNAKGLDIKYIEPNYKVKLLDNDVKAQSYPINSNQAWHYNMINVQTAWNITPGSSNVKIAVLDTGIDYNHTSLANFVDMTLARTYEGSSVFDGHGHGTHVSGTIASYGTVSGVMRNAKIVPIKVLSNSGTGSTYNIQQGIIYAADCGVDAINMSLGGGGYSQAMYDACQYAVNNNVVVVAASGNNGTGTVSYPARYDNVIAVGSVNSNRARSSFSQYGTGLNIMAPGNQIYSTVPNNGFAYNSGTSMATPHVAGVVGLMRSANSSLSVAQIRTIISQTAQYAGPQNQYGSGIIDAGAAVTSASNLATMQNQQTEYYVYSAVLGYSYNLYK